MLKNGKNARGVDCNRLGIISHIGQFNPENIALIDLMLLTALFYNSVHWTAPVKTS